MNRVAKQVAMTMALGVVGILAGCGDGGIEFNGLKQVEQFPVRKTPIVHYNMPSEVTDPVTGDHSIDVSTFTTINLWQSDFTEQAVPGHDLWVIDFYGYVADAPIPPGFPAFVYATDFYKTPGAAWPDAAVTSGMISWPNVTNLITDRWASGYIGAWTLSLMHQWFLREVNGSAIVPAVLGNPPVQYESLEFSSMKISIVELQQAVSPFTPLVVPGAQQEAITVGPVLPGVNAVEQIITPANNVCGSNYNGQGAPAGMLAAAWQEAPAQNIFIETSYGPLQGVPAPPYFAGAGAILAGGGVYNRRFSDQWQQTTSGTTSTIDIDDGVQYAYYLAAVHNHCIGYGVGLIDSGFALPGVTNDQEDIMSQSVILDMTAFIAAGKEFNFVVEDLLRMQDVVNGDFTTPGGLSTLPGSTKSPTGPVLR